MPRLPGNLDVITQPLYDRVTIAAAGQTQLRYFSTPKGQGGKTANDTNMELAGQLPSPWTFDIRGLAFKLAPGVTTVDAKLIVATGALVLTIGSKDFLTLPLQLVPSGAGITLQSDIGAALATNLAVNNGMPDPRAIFMLTRPITILENENFNVTITWDANLTPAVDVKSWVILHGELSRSVQ